MPVDPEGTVAQGFPPSWTMPWERGSMDLEKQDLVAAQELGERGVEEAGRERAGLKIRRGIDFRCVRNGC
jgi:hypothetical protein